MENKIKISPFLPLLLAFSGFMQMLDATILNTALPSIAKDLSVSPLRMQMVIISYSLTMALIMPLSGYLSDRFGTRKLFIFSLFFFTLGSIFCALSSSLSLLICSRIIQGLGGAMLLPIQRLVLLRAYSKQELLDKLNLVVIPALLGPILGPVIGGYLCEYASWQWIFLVNLPFGIVGIIAACKMMPNFRAEKLPSLDKLGFLFFSLSVLFLTLSAEIAVRPERIIYAAIIFMAGISFFMLYWRHSYFYPQALFPINLLKIRSYRIGLIGNLFARISMSAVPFLLPLMLQLVGDFSPSQSGNVLLFLALGNLFAKAFAQKILQKVGYRSVLIWNTRLIGLFIIFLGLLPLNFSTVLIFLLVFILGILHSMQFLAMNTITLSRLRPHQTASGTNLVVVNQQLAVTFSVAIAAIFLNFFRSFENLPVINCFHYSFLVLGIMEIFSSFIFSFLHKLDGRELIKT
ncbi:MAG: DHA2 family efflux MFS transporter permease subunit [Cardiobacteriaceae bacterium]|nr:DHA2 family efflux MFS transporter permease subunit [Cardiobacteriaceae bacterium]